MNTKIFASVSGVCIAAAVVIGSVLAVANRDRPAPPAAPVGNAITPTATVTATVTASPKPVAAVKVSPSTKQAVPKRQAVVRQEAPVTDPSQSSQPAVDQPTSREANPAGNADPIHGSAVRYGPTDSPPSRVQIGYPDDTLSASPKE